MVVSHIPAGYSSPEILRWRDSLTARDEAALSKTEADEATEKPQGCLEN